MPGLIGQFGLIDSLLFSFFFFPLARADLQTSSRQTRPVQDEAESLTRRVSRRSQARLPRLQQTQSHSGA